MVRETELMGDHHHRHSVVHKRLHHVEHLADELDVERGRWLVEEHRLRPHHERPRDRDALLLTARQLLRILRALVGETDTSEELERLAPRVLLGEPAHLDQPAHHVLERSHVLEQVEALEDHADLARSGRCLAERNRPAVGLFEQAQAPQ